MRRLLIGLAIGMLMMTSAAVAAERTGGPPRGDRERARGRSVQLTPEQKELLERAKDLRKQIRIARLELQLAEAQDAPEGEIAARAERLYALLGRQHAFQVKNRGIFRQVRGQMGRRWQHRRGQAVAPGRRGAGRGMGRGMGHGGAGMGWQGMRGQGWDQGPGLHRGAGPRWGRDAGAGLGMGWQRGQGMRGQGQGRGMGGGMGRGRGAGMYRNWEEPMFDETAPAPEFLPAEEYEE